MMLFRLVGKIVTKILFWREVAIQREALGSLSDELLKDIGITRAEAVREASRPFWDTAPAEDGLYRRGPSAVLKQRTN
ncbi:hypothetical protein DESUT3_19540 [Desulfuromonas versatilis]|uniref:YjiS-like domain-containing protein n=2 Tax=Desulfuromonas versatilis TaxID=2802975 RepID=A0ABN6DXZ1_9BACT|nr:hypothetical protein DESUT3_19540 [Desulfuromonas versatilis]